MARTQRVQVHDDLPLIARRLPLSDGLAILGLRQGELVRWKHLPAGRWQQGSVTHRERDGSIGITDWRGLSRSLPVDRLEVRRAGPRGASRWEPLTERVSRSEQLRLL
jgi:hypothetical protein